MELNREEFLTFIRRAYFSGLEDGVAEVPPAPGWTSYQGAEQETLWQRSDAKALVDTWFPQTL